MGVIELAGRRWLQTLAISVLLAMATGCAGVSEHTQWPDVDVVADGAPAQDEGALRFERGDDGMLYIVGDTKDPLEAGQSVFGRYGGQWPLEESPRPALVAGHITEVYDNGVAHFHPTYEFPDTDHQELRVDVEDEAHQEEMGKGLAVIEDIDYSGPTHLELSLGAEAGVQEGDMYGILASRDADKGAEAAQLTRRLLGICMVVESNATDSVCRLWQGHPAHDWAGTIEEGQQVTFLEPTFGTSPREAKILVSQVDDDEINDRVLEHLKAYFSRYPGANVTVEAFDEKEVDASSTNFHRYNRRIDTDDPAALVGVGIEDIDGEERLRLNYTGLGTAVGSGMVAAPPAGGVDMGPVDDLSSEQWQGFSSMLMGTVFVYRGQNAEALMHLHEALRDAALTGKWRWHARDQYAMRWGAVNRYEESFWLVHEDEAVATDNDDERALYNAIGTRVRLHDFVDQPEQALELAERYLQWRIDDKPDTGYLSARAMYAEMAAQADEVDLAKESTEELIELCPDGCGGDLMAMLAGVYWGSMESSPELQDRVVETMVSVARSEAETSLASARMFQGWTYMRDDDQEQAMIAFLEAQRLFEQENSAYGYARAQFYLALTRIRLDEPQQAFEQAMEALEYMTEIRDYMATTRIYERLSEIYIDIDFQGPPEPYMGAATQVLQGGLHAQLATGDYGRAADAGFGYGHFLFRIGNVDEARYTLQRAVWHGIRSARFDIVALCHAFLGIIARAEGDMELFEAELGRARLMAGVADEPYIDELIDELDSPSADEPEPEDPTQLL